MKNKTATECWNILRGELDSAIDSCVPMKKQGKRSKKKHLSKEAFRKNRYKQHMWLVYKHHTFVHFLSQVELVSSRLVLSAVWLRGIVGV